MRATTFRRALFILIVIGFQAPFVWAADCKVSGCSGQLCTDKEGMMSTCEWRPEYDCIKTQKCERQADGNCGWTPTETSKKCFKDKLGKDESSGAKTIEAEGSLAAPKSSKKKPKRPKSS